MHGWFSWRPRVALSTCGLRHGLAASSPAAAKPASTGPSGCLPSSKLSSKYLAVDWVAARLWHHRSAQLLPRVLFLQRLLSVDAHLEVLLHAFSEGEALLGTLWFAARGGAESMFALSTFKLLFVSLDELLGEVEELFEPRDFCRVCFSSVDRLLLSASRATTSAARA